MAFRKKSEVKQDPDNGGWMSGRKAKRAAGSGGGIKGDKVVDPKGRVIKDLRGRQLRQRNEHDV
jgi:hypothetical protein